MTILHHDLSVSNFAHRVLSRRTALWLSMGAATSLLGCKQVRAPDAATLAEAGRTCAGFNVGQGSSVLGYVFFDPLCAHCQRLWAECRALHATHLLAWIPVALNERSFGPAVELLKAPSPVTLMEEIKAEQTTATAVPAPMRAYDPKDHTLSLVKKNGESLQRTGMDSVPVVVRAPREGIPAGFLVGGAAAPNLVRFLDGKA
jgi:hypothetical protein